MVQNLRRERLQEDRESKCISARSVALPLKRNFAYWGALWGRHWGFMQLPVFRHKASSPHNAGRWHLPLSAHTFLRAAASSHRSSWVAEWKSSYLKKKSAHQVLRSKWSGTLRGRGEVVHATGLMESNYLALGRVPGFRSFLPLRHSTAFPWPRRWPGSGQNSEQLALSLSLKFWH